MDSSNLQLPAQAVQALEQGRLIQAIKILRMNSGLDLLAAKTKVDAYLAANPATKARCAAAMASGSLSLGRITTFALVIVAAIVVWLKMGGRF